ncbi:hypothetical protein [Nocardioides sp. YIM 152315]|uniref:hypothetical protein n=1 Tax=Nocardioides sp. YIM 152315 TaxID=3031760 RepID=UPI0023DB4B98|nr:hypothetical protein [Nocardioides sp. YIM 152315]MDF1602213.1 hypothetical protein [Nocardioides sp. YIM 152315]
MSRLVRSLVEFIRPGTLHSPSIPPLEAGLRPNTRLETAAVLARSERHCLDDIVLAEGRLFVSAGTTVLEVQDDDTQYAIAELSGDVTALAAANGRIMAAVDGVGLVAINPSGGFETWCSDPLVRRGVTAIALATDDAPVLTIGSTSAGADGWTRSLVSDDRSGLLLRVDPSTGKVETLDTGLAWPSGVTVAGEEFLISLSHDHRIERGTLAQPRRRSVLRANLPGYPGRIVALDDGGWWVAVPYLRNRATELILTETEALADMVRSVPEELWLTPTHGVTNVYREPLQVGQLRVMGIVKPWAPPRSYGLAFRLDADGLIVESVHSRPDGDVHGVTGIALPGRSTLVLVARGSGKIVTLEEHHD